MKNILKIAWDVVLDPASGLIMIQSGSGSRSNWEGIRIANYIYGFRSTGHIFWQKPLYYAESNAENIFITRFSLHISIPLLSQPRLRIPQSTVVRKSENLVYLPCRVVLGHPVQKLFRFSALIKTIFLQP